MYGLHIIQYPTGRWGYVGSVPGSLGTYVPATRADVMGGRSEMAADGTIVAIKFPVFDTREDALAFAAERGFVIKSSHP